MTLRFDFGRPVALVAVAAALFAAGCSKGGDDAAPPQGETVAVAATAPGYCQELSQLPAGLTAAVGNAAAGAASAADKDTISKAAAQLRRAAAGNGVPQDMQTILNNAAASLDKLSGTQSPTEADVTAFGKALENLGGAVNTVCSAK